MKESSGGITVCVISGITPNPLKMKKRKAENSLVIWFETLELQDYPKPCSNSSLEKSRIRETKQLSTDADRSTDAIGGWTKNTPKPDFLEKREKSSKTQKLKNV